MKINPASQTPVAFKSLSDHRQPAYVSPMRTEITTPIRKLIALATMGVALNQWVDASEPTAFDLIKEGNRYVGEQSKDKVVQIRSDKSVASLTPGIWYVVYYDPTATLKATEVKFGKGKMLEVKRPFRLLEPVTGDDKQLDRKKFKVDSDKALRIATKEPLLQNLKLTATQFWLQRGDDGGPVWKVRLWAAKLRKPAEDVDIGDIYVAAGDGKVLKTDLRINRVD